jgi:hypothetical protein
MIERCIRLLAPLLRELDDGLVTLCDCEGDDVCTSCEPPPRGAATTAAALR